MSSGSEVMAWTIGSFYILFLVLTMLMVCMHSDDLTAGAVVALALGMTALFPRLGAGLSEGSEQVRDSSDESAATKLDNSEMDILPALLQSSNNVKYNNLVSPARVKIESLLSDRDLAALDTTAKHTVPVSGKKVLRERIAVHKRLHLNERLRNIMDTNDESGLEVFIRQNPDYDWNKPIGDPKCPKNPPLHYCIRQGRLQDQYRMYRQLVAHPAVDINIPGDSNKTPMMYATSTFGLDVLRFYDFFDHCINSGKPIDWHAQDDDGWTFLIYLTWNLGVDARYERVLELCSAGGADPNVQDRDGFTALMLAARRNQANVNVLFRHFDNINVDLVDNKKRSAQWYAGSNANVIPGP